MRLLDRLTVTRKHSLFLMPFIMTVVLECVVLFSMFWIGAPYKWNVLGCSIILLIVWGGLWLWDRNSILLGSDEGRQAYVEIHTVLYIGAILVISWFMACSAWERYLTLNPVQAIDNGIMNQDTLFYASIAEGYNNSSSAILLVNDEPRIQAHTFSMYVMHLFSKISGIRAFFAYNYLYPLIFFPLCGFVFLKAISGMKEFFIGNKSLSDIDIALVTFGIIGILPKSILYSIGIWKEDLMVSPSYMVAVVLSLAFLFVISRGLLSKEIREQRYFCIAILPIFIVLISASKISVGCIMTGAICYYLFRSNEKFSLMWWMSFVYGFVFLACVVIFSSADGYGGLHLQLLSFRKYCNNDNARLFFHYLYLSFPIIVLCFMQTIREKYNFASFRSGKTVWLELMAVVTAIGFLPGLMLYLGSAVVYFSYFVEIIGIVFLCASNCLHGAMKCLQGKRGVVLLLWAIIILMRHSPLTPINWSQMENVHYSQIFYEAERIRQIMTENEKDYAIFLQQDARGAQMFKHPISKVFLYPALTGCSVVNATYRLNNTTYNYADEEVSGYGLHTTQQDKLSLSEAAEKARFRGKKYLIEISSNGYTVISLIQ